MYTQEYKVVHVRAVFKCVIGKSQMQWGNQVCMLLRESRRLWNGVYMYTVYMYVQWMYMYVCIKFTSNMLPLQLFVLVYIYTCVCFTLVMLGAFNLQTKRQSDKRQVCTPLCPWFVEFKSHTCTSRLTIVKVSYKNVETQNNVQVLLIYRELLH